MLEAAELGRARGQGGGGDEHGRREGETRRDGMRPKNGGGLHSCLPPGRPRPVPPDPPTNCLYYDDYDYDDVWEE